MFRFQSDAEELIHNYYASSRKPKGELEGVSIRQLQGIIRLSIARAKVDMSRSVTCEHVGDIIKLLECTTHGSQGAFNKAPSQKAGKKSKAEKINEFLVACGDKGTSLSVDEMRQHYDRMEMPFFSFDCFLDMLRDSGLVIKVSNKVYKLV